MKRSPLPRILGTALFLAALSSSALAAPTQFTDVPETHWASGYITTVAEQGWVSGVGEGKFAPDDTLSTAQFAAMLCNALYSQELDAVRAQCGPDKPWYVPAHMVAEQHHLYTATARLETEGSILDPIPREDMAAILYNVLMDHHLPMPNPNDLLDTMNRIPDLDVVSIDREEPVGVCYHLGLLSGVDGAGRFAPEAFLVRGQAAVILCRLDSLLPDRDPPAEPEQPIPAHPHAPQPE